MSSEASKMNAEKASAHSCDAENSEGASHSETHVTPEESNLTSTLIAGQKRTHSSLETSELTSEESRVIKASKTSLAAEATPSIRVIRHRGPEENPSPRTTLSQNGIVTQNKFDKITCRVFQRAAVRLLQEVHNFKPLQKMTQEMTAGCLKDVVAADIGAGNGQFTFELLKNPNWKFTGRVMVVDTDPQFRKVFDKPKNVSFLCSDLCHRTDPFSTMAGNVHYLFSTFFLQHPGVGYQRAQLAQMYRMLKPGGVIGLTCWQEIDLVCFTRMALRELNEQMTLSEEPFILPRVMAPDDLFIDRETFTQALSDAGFADVKMELVIPDINCQGANNWCDHWLSSLGSMSTSALDQVRQRPEYYTKFAEIFRKLVSNTPIIRPSKVQWRYWVVIARKPILDGPTPSFEDLFDPLLYAALEATENPSATLDDAGTRGFVDAEDLFANAPLGALFDESLAALENNGLGRTVDNAAQTSTAAFGLGDTRDNPIDFTGDQDTTPNLEHDPFANFGTGATFDQMMEDTDFGDDTVATRQAPYASADTGSWFEQVMANDGLVPTAAGAASNSFSTFGTSNLIGQDMRHTGLQGNAANGGQDPFVKPEASRSEQVMANDGLVPTGAVAGPNSFSTFGTSTLLGQDMGSTGLQGNTAATRQDPFANSQTSLFDQVMANDGLVPTGAGAGPNSFLGFAANGRQNPFASYETDAMFNQMSETATPGATTTDTDEDAFNRFMAGDNTVAAERDDSNRFMGRALDYGAAANHGPGNNGAHADRDS